MAVRDDFAAGEVLAAADLNDTFASKLPYSYGTATPSTTVEGFVWFDENFAPPLAKVWNGSAFVAFSQGPADFSDAASGTYTDTGVDYKYLTFTASGTLTVTRAGFADVLVVGGGGGGGRYVTNGAGGGGGAGGHLYVTNAYLPTGTLTVTVGAGGAGFSGAGGAGFSGANFVPGLNGVSSRLGDYYAIGGGGGGAGSDAGRRPGNTGGSGGGAGGDNGGESGGTGTSGQGNNGGTSPSAASIPQRCAGGGGGADAVGGNGNGSTGTGGAGGAGLANGITGSSTTRAGGGGGAGLTTGGAGGSGGGGAGGGGNPAAGSNGTVNTGGGGGGAGGASTSGNGGSGIVVVRVRTN